MCGYIATVLVSLKANTLLSLTASSVQHACSLTTSKSIAAELKREVAILKAELIVLQTAFEQEKESTRSLVAKCAVLDSFLAAKGSLPRESYSSVAHSRPNECLPARSNRRPKSRSQQEADGVIKRIHHPAASTILWTALMSM